MKVELLSHTIDPEILVATAAKLCYSASEIKDLMEKQTLKKTEEFLNRLPSKHQSILEHVSFTFAVEDVSRVTEIQLVRHRIASYSIQSGRYVKRSNLNFIEPPLIKECEDAHKVFENICVQSREAYNEIVIDLIWKQMHNTLKAASIEEKEVEINKLLIEDKQKYKKFEKVAIENARYAHLQATPTRIILTMNLRSLKHFYNERCCNRAQWEIREMANKMLKISKEKFPLLFKDVGPSCKVLGYCPENEMQCDQAKNKIPTSKDIKF